MHNVFRVLMRDLKRIAKAPASWVVILVLIILPSLYTWFNVVGFWNPYNNTGALKVCVVNEDEGAHNDLLGDLQLGDQIMDQLHENTQLNWEFTDYDDAMAKISSGEAYAAFVIPSDFSEDMTTLLTGEFQRPQLEYYVNEKLNPVAPKITDTGASTLDNTINDTFVSTVSSVVAETLNDKIAESQESFDASKAKVSAQIDKVDANLSDARESVSGLSTASSDAIAQANSAKSSLSDARREIGAFRGFGSCRNIEYRNREFLGQYVDRHKRRPFDRFCGFHEGECRGGRCRNGNSGGAGRCGIRDERCPERHRWQQGNHFLFASRGR